MIDSVLRLYNIFYSNYSGNRVYDFKPSQKDLKTINNTINLLKNHYQESLGEEIWIEYFTYSFRKRENQLTRFGKGKIQLNWIFGKKAVDTWLSNRDDNWLYFNKEFRNRYNIRVINADISIGEDIKNDYKIRERKRFYNSDRGLLHCQELELFEKYNRQCLSCINHKICSK